MSVKSPPLPCVLCHFAVPPIIGVLILTVNGVQITHHHYSGDLYADCLHSGFLRSFNTQKVSLVWKWLIAGWQMRFANVVMLLVCRWGIRSGLSTIGFIQSLISIATSFGSASIILMLVLVILTMLAAVTTSSGNAPFYAFVEMILKLAHSSGINPAYLTIPMLQASNWAVPLSPVSGVVVAVCRDGEDLAV